MIENWIRGSNRFVADRQPNANKRRKGGNMAKNTPAKKLPSSSPLGLEAKALNSPPPPFRIETHIFCNAFSWNPSLGSSKAVDGVEYLKPYWRA